MDLEKLFTDTFKKQQDDVNSLVLRIEALAEKTGARLELSNERIGQLENALSKIKGKTAFDWAMTIIQLIFALAILVSVFNGYNVNYKDFKFEKVPVSAFPSPSANGN